MAAPDYRVDILRGLGAPLSQENLGLLSRWQGFEGGHTNNSAKWNWFNTTTDEPGAVSAGTSQASIKAYPDYATGIKGTVDTLLNGRYAGLVAGLRSGKPSADPGTMGSLSTWLSGSSTSNAGLKYAKKVMGGGGGPVAPAGAASAPGQGQVAASAAPAQPGGMSPLLASLLGSLGDFSKTGKATFSSNLGSLLTQAKAQAANSRNLASVGPTNSDGGSETPGQYMQGGSKQVNGALSVADSQIGKPYVFGSGPDTKSFDCSDLIQYSYKQQGIDLPRTTSGQIKAGVGVDYKGEGSLRPGDLIFPTGHHVVMYVGNGKVIAAPHTGTNVQYQPLSNFGHPVAVRRVVKS